MRTIITIIFSVCAFCVQAQLVETYDYQSSVDGKMFHFQVSREQLLKTPVWHLDENFPPLSPRAAEKVAKEQLNKLVKNTSQWTESRIILDDEGDKIHWVYLVQFRHFAQRDQDAWQLKVVVLMDGTVVEPKITEQKSPPS